MLARSPTPRRPVGDDVDLVEHALLAQHLLRGRQVERGQGCAGEVVRLAEPGDARRS